MCFYSSSLLQGLTDPPSHRPLSSLPSPPPAPDSPHALISRYRSARVSPHHGCRSSLILLSLSRRFLESFVRSLHSAPPPHLALLVAPSLSDVFPLLLALYASPPPPFPRFLPPLAMIHGLYRCLFAPRANRFAMMSSAPLASTWQYFRDSNGGKFAAIAVIIYRWPVNRISLSLSPRGVRWRITRVSAVLRKRSAHSIGTRSRRAPSARVRAVSRCLRQPARARKRVSLGD